MWKLIENILQKRRQDPPKDRMKDLIIVYDEADVFLFEKKKEPKGK